MGYVHLEGHPNIARGLLNVDLPELEAQGLQRFSDGKVRNRWLVPGKGNAEDRILLVTTDRLSAYDWVVCAVPGKGQALNRTTNFWMTHPEIGAVVPNHLLAEPHPNVTVARYVDKRLPVELVMRKCLAESSTTTSIAYNYFKLGRRTIYGIDFPEGLEPNQEFPEDLGTKEGMGEGGIIITPTTKGEAGAHDEELTNEQAAQLVDSQFGDGTWEEVKALALRSYVVASRVAREGGILIADTKQEWGFMDGKLGLIDEVFTPDSSRFWLVATYAERLAAGQRPQSYDKEMARKRLDELGYHGGPDVPVLDPSFIDATGDAYKIPYQMISGQAIDYIAVDSARIEEAVRNHLGM